MNEKLNWTTYLDKLISFHQCVHRQLALFFLDESTTDDDDDDLQRVLFEIDADPLLNVQTCIKIFSIVTQHPWIVMTLDSKGDAHKHNGNFQEVLLFYEQAITIYRHSLPPSHHDIVHIEQLIRDVSVKLK
ncbi:unnamed protein product [Rotaria socialis]|uniref:Uncharacterized protein n=1 Tax=Rotaria socialis TaxID=392032 RepID=A0A818NEJ0_9BILA|nr:unnamed protein product [Rotaria socialis]